MTLFIDSLRYDLGNDGLPFLFSLVSCNIDPFYYTDTVRDAQIQVNDDIPGTILFNFDDLPKLTDYVHYNGTALIEIGRRYANEIKTMP